MKPIVHSILLLALSGGPAWAAKAPFVVKSADIQTGYLEVIWGDPKNAQKPAELVVTLVTPQGRIQLDAGQAMEAAEDWSALSGRKVAMYRNRLSGDVEAIVPADGTTSAAALPNLSVQESHPWKTIACKFPDVAHLPVTIDFLSKQYGRMRGRIGHFWHEMSYGKVDVQGKAYGWFELPRPRSHYMVEGRMDTTALGTDCMQAAVPHVDFTGTYGVNIALNHEVGGVAYGGRLCADFPGFQQPCVPMTWLPIFGYRSLRVMMHEMGHAYTLPHSDNSDGDADTYDNAWDLMSRISWAPQHPILGGRPQYLTGWHRKRLGWMPAERITTVYENPRQPTLIYLDSASNNRGTGKHMAILRAYPQRDREGNVPNESEGIHYVFEARTYDVDFDRGLPGEAVIIHRIAHGGTGKAIAMDADIPPANINTNEGSMFKVGERWTPVEGFGTMRVLARTPTGFWISIGPNR